MLGATARLDIMPQSAGVTTQVTVSAQPSAIDPAQTFVATVVETERIEEDQPSIRPQHRAVAVVYAAAGGRWGEADPVLNRLRVLM